MVRTLVYNEYSDNSTPVINEKQGGHPRFYTPVNQYKQFFQNETKSHEKQVARPGYRPKEE